MIKYATLDGYPVRLTDTEAWECVNGNWQKLDTADAHHKAALLTEEQYARMFPQLPGLPTTAFQSGESES
jgi:hypothetical protein